MGKRDNRHTPKMTRRRHQEKKKDRERRQRQRKYRERVGKTQKSR